MKETSSMFCNESKNKRMRIGMKILAMLELPDFPAGKKALPWQVNSVEAWTYKKAMDFSSFLFASLSSLQPHLFIFLLVPLEYIAVVVSNGLEFFESNVTQQTILFLVNA